MAPYWSDDPHTAKELVGVVDWYKVFDRRRLAAALEANGEVEYGSDDVWRWFEASPQGRRQVAELEILEGDTLAVEAASEADIRSVKTELEKTAGSAIGFLIGQEGHRPCGASKG
jgi:hypothetical protein